MYTFIIGFSSMSIFFGELFFATLKMVEGKVNLTDGMLWVHRDVVHRVAKVMEHLMNNDQVVDDEADRAQIEALEWWLAHTNHAQLVFVDKNKEIVVYNTGKEV